VTTAEDLRAASLPLRRRELLREAIGRTLLDIDRWTATTPSDFVARGGLRSLHFSRCSGPTIMSFGDGLVHSWAGWPSQLSIIVDGNPVVDVAYSERYRLSDCADTAPAWLRACLGRSVRDVLVHVYRDDVPSDEARQAAVSYLLDSGVELWYGTELHGRSTSDELLRGDEVPRDHVASTVSMADAG
jgi:hypothetical protein